MGNKPRSFRDGEPSVGRPCTVCQLAADDRQALDLALATDQMTQRRAAARWALSPSAVWRHRQRHLPASLLSAFTELGEPSMSVHDLASELRRTLDLVNELVAEARAEGRGSRTDFIRAADLQRRQLDSLARLLGLVVDHVDVRASISLETAPEWLSLKARIINAVADHPEARLAVVAALDDADEAV